MEGIASFINDSEKMADFYIMSEEDFLASYSYLTTDEYKKTLAECREYLDREIHPAFGYAMSESGIKCFYKLMHDMALDFGGANRYAWLCTLFGYDIGEEYAKAISKWYFENGLDVMELTSEQKGTVKNICNEELDIYPVFDDWKDTTPNVTEYGWMGRFRFPEPKPVKLQKIIRIGSYTLVKRNSDYEPFIAAYMYRDEDDTWANGNYFDNSIDALMYILQQERPADVISAAINICDRNQRGDIADLLVEMNFEEEGS